MPKQKRTLADYVSTCTETGVVAAYRLKLGDGSKDLETVALLTVGKVFKADKDTRPVAIDPQEEDVAEAIEAAASDAGWGSESRTLRVDALDEAGRPVTSWSQSIDIEEDEPNGRKAAKASGSDRWDYGQKAVASSNDALIRMLDAGTRHVQAQSTVIEKMSAQFGEAIERVLSAVDTVSDTREAAFSSMVENTLSQMQAEVAESDDPMLAQAWEMFSGFFRKLFPEGMKLDGIPSTPADWAKWARKNPDIVKSVLSDPAVVEAVTGAAKSE